MYHEAIKEVLKNAKRQAIFLSKNLFGYLVSAIISGIFISLSVMLSATVSVQNQSSPIINFLSGTTGTFGLIMVVFAGTMLFTANTFVITLGALKKTITWLELVKVVAAVYFGNWIGTLILSLVYKGSGHLAGAYAQYYINAFSSKLDLSFMQIMLRGFLCNILVCAAIWSTHRFSSFSAKFMIIFFALTAFIATGYENSIASMSQGSLALLAPGGLEAIGIGNYLRIVFTDTLGNILAGVLVFALPLWLFSKHSKAELEEHQEHVF